MVTKRNQGNSPKTDRQQDTDDLRKRAEAQNKQNNTDVVSSLSDVDQLRLIHELQVHQIELEMQKEELILVRAELEDALDQYTSLYDYAPTGYFTLNRDGKILKVNLNGAALLGSERSKLVGRRFQEFVADHDRPDFLLVLKNLFGIKSSDSCELSLLHTVPDQIGVSQSSGDAKAEANKCQVRIEAVATADQQTCQMVVIDITARKHAEQALHESEEHFRTIADFTADWEVWIDPDGNYKYCSPSCKVITGYPPEKFVESADFFLSIVHPDDREMVSAHIGLENKNCQVMTLDFRIHTNDGQERWIEHVCQPVFSPEGLFLGVRGNNRDITEKKAIEKSFRENEERYRLLYQRSPLGYQSLDADGNFIEVNNSWLETFGYSREEVIGHWFGDFLIPEMVEAFRQRFPQFKATGEVHNDFQMVRKDGRVITVAFDGKIGHDSKGEFKQTHCVLRDITEQKRAEEALRESEFRLRTLFEQAAVGVSLIETRTGRYIDVNQKYCNFLGYTKTEMLNLTFQNVSHPGDIEENVANNKLLMDGKISEFTMEKRLVRKDGKIVWINLTVSPLWKSGEVSDKYIHISFVQDITDRKQAEEALRKSEANLNKAQQVANIGSWTWHIPTNQLEWSDQMYRIFDVDKDEFSGDLADVMARAIHPDDRTAVEASNLSVINHRKPIPLEYRIIWPDGTQRVVWAEAGELILDDEGKPVLLSGIVQDITDRKQKQDEIESTKAKLEAALASMTDAVSISDTEGRLVNFNEAFTTFHKFQSKDEMAETFGEYPEFLEVYMPDGEFVPFDQWAVSRALRGETGTNVEYTLRRKDTGETWVGNYNFAPILNQDGEIAGSVVTAHDITERKKSIDALQESELRFRTLFEHAAVGVALLETKTGRYVDINQKYCDFVGYTKTEILDLTFQDVTHPKDIEENRKNNELLIAGEIREFTIEKRYVRKDGKIVWGVLTVSPLWAPGEKPPVNLHIAIVQDITERKRAEEALRKSEASLNKAQQVANIGSWTWHIPTNQLEWSDQMYAIFGINKDESSVIWHEVLSQRVHPDDIALIHEANKTIMSGGIPKPVEYRVVWPDGSTHIVSDEVGEIILDEDGKPLIVTGIVQDITERKRAEEALRESEERFRKLFREAPLGIALTDSLTGRFIDVNPMHAQISGRTIEEMLKITWMDITHPDDIQKDTESMALLIAGKINGYQMEKRYLHKDGSAVWINMTITPIEMEDKSHRWHLSMIEDITERRQMAMVLQEDRNLLAQRVKERTAALSRANAELMKALQTRDEFLANMSHELRTPLTSILGISEILEMGLRGPLNAPQIKGVQTIQESGAHLLALINDILDLSKIEAGKLEIEPDLMVVEDVCQASISLVKGMAHKKNQTLMYNLSDPQLKIWADARRVKQIVVNLLSNAVKFTPEGGRISLDVGLDREQGRVKFVVQDSGIGISQVDIGKLFQPFMQLDSKLSRQYEGSGLGLALVRRLVELHRGEVFVESEGVSGKGSRFTVLLPWEDHFDPGPMSASDAVGVDAPVLTRTGQLRAVKQNEDVVILLAEDNPTNALTISEYLQLFGYQIIHAKDGREAIEIATARLPDLILMDIQMPLMDGFEAMRRLRQDARFKETPILALTALAMPGDLERCLEAGANDYLTKPIMIKDLLNKVRENLKTGG